MKTILYTLSQLNRSGPNIILYGIIKHLDRTRYIPIILTLSDTKGMSIEPEFVKLGVQIINLHLSQLQWMLKGRKIMARVLRQIQPDLIHCHGFRDMCLIRLAAKQYPKIATIHCDFAIDYRLKYGILLGKLMAVCQWRLLKAFRLRLCVSKLLANTLNTRQNTLHFDYVNNGIDTDIFCPALDKKALRKALGLPPNKTIFIWIGSFIKTKNPMLLVNLIKKIEDKKAFFIFCGARGSLLASAQQALEGFKNVLFTGYTNQIASYLQASDCYISTSLSEGFHLTVYEALACGLPVILSDLPIYQAIKQTKCGLFFPRQQKQALYTHIQHLLDGQSTERQTEEGKKLVAESFSSQAMSQTYQQYYEDCLK